MDAREQAELAHPVVWGWPNRDDPRGWQHQLNHQTATELEIIPLASQILRSLWVGEGEARAMTCVSDDAVTGRIQDKALAHQAGVDVETDTPACEGCPASVPQGRRKKAPCSATYMVWAIERSSGDAPIRIRIPEWVAGQWAYFVEQVGQAHLPGRIVRLSARKWDTDWPKLIVEEIRELGEERVAKAEARRDDVLDAMLAVGVNLEVLSSGPAAPPQVSEENQWLFATDESSEAIVAPPEGGSKK